MKTLKKISYGKMLAVLFLTCLIWVWADLMLDDTYDISSTLSVSKSINSSLWVSLGANEQQTITIEDIKLKGPASKISQVKQKLDSGSLDLSKFWFKPSDKGMVAGGTETLDLRQFLRESGELRQLGLTVDSCKPEKIQVKIVKLVQKQVRVDCLDENGNIIKDAIIEPAQIMMFVPDYGSRDQVAFVKLTPGQRANARLNAVKRKPYIVLSPEQNKEADTEVEIRLLGQETKLQDYTITPATIGYVLSDTMARKYYIDCLNMLEMTTVSIQATPAARDAYKNQPYKILLYILDGDENAGQDETISRQVIYNFPEEYVKKGEITLKQSPDTAQFKLVERPAATPSPAVVP